MGMVAAKVAVWMGDKTAVEMVAVVEVLKEMEMVSMVGNMVVAQQRWQRRWQRRR